MDIENNPITDLYWEKGIDAANEEILLQQQSVRFIKQIAKLECLEFLGIARILCVPITKICALPIVESERVQMRELEDIFSDMIDRFVILGRPQRGELLQVVSEAIKTRKRSKK